MSIWKYREIKRFMDNAELLTLDEGGTTLESYEDGKLLLKREDQNPTGSWKDRGTAFKITQLKKDNIQEAVLSSSGNAAISFLTYANKLYPELKLHIVVSPDISEIKKQKINELIAGTKHEFHQTESTRKTSIELAAHNKISNLRASIDDEIVKGYWSLGFELADTVELETVIFVPVSSGTALVGLVQGLQMKLAESKTLPRIFVCQTSSVYPIVEKLNLPIQKQEGSLADAIIDTIALRSPQILKIINETKGSAYAISDEELQDTKEFITKLKTQNTELSYTSLLSVAGYLRAKKEGMQFDKAICIASGL